jgi:peroxiredoxin
MSSTEDEKEPRRAWSPVVLVLLASAFFGYAVLPRFSRPSPTQSAMLGTAAPDFSLPVFHGGDAGSRIRLSALAGNVVVLDFWASWCRPCVVQSRILTELAPDYENAKVLFVGVNTADDPESAREFAGSHRLPYPSVLDTEGAAEAYGARSLPTLVIIDPTGHVSNVTTGVMDADELRSAIERAERARSGA